MLKFSLILIAMSATPALAQDAPAPAGAPPPPTKISAEAMANDPRMIAAIRRANMNANHKCGENIGGITDLALKADAQRCRRRMVEAAKLDAESEIEGH